MNDRETDWTDAWATSPAFLELPYAAIVTARSGMIHHANHAAARALHVPRAFLCVRPLICFVARRDCRAFRDLIRRADHQPQTERIALRPRHGGEVFQAVVRVVESAAGSLLWSFVPASSRVSLPYIDEPYVGVVLPEASMNTSPEDAR